MLKKGFTLIELMIVIVIIAILAVALLPSVFGTPLRAHDAARRADIKNIVNAVETYNNDNQKYPSGKLCINSKEPTFAKYFTGGAPPEDPWAATANKSIGGCPAGSYLYCQTATSSNNYYVAAYMEITGDGNATANDIGTSPDCGANAAPPASLTKPTATDTAVYVVEK